MSTPSADISYSSYAKMFVMGAITGYIAYTVVDYLDMGMLPPGAPTAAVGAGLGAIVAPMVMAKVGLNY